MYANTTVGFCATVYMNFGASIIFLSTNVLVLSLFVTIGLFFNTYRTHFGAMFQDMNDLVGTKHSRDNVIRLKLCLIEAIHFNIEVKK